MATGKRLIFLVDTGADISILKEEADYFNSIQDDSIINIQGISQEIIESKGLTSIELQTDKYIIPHSFHIVNQQFPIPCDGIIGIDFIKKFNCQLDFKPKEDWFIIRPNNLKFPIYVPITYNSGNNRILLPARSQVVRKINITSIEDTNILIPNQEIETGIYVANTISTSNDVYIRILNTHHTDKLVDANNVVQPNKETREQTVLSQLSKKLPPQFKTQLKKLCSKYTDTYIWSDNRTNIGL